MVRDRSMAAFAIRLLFRFCLHHRRKENFFVAKSFRLDTGVPNLRLGKFQRNA